MEKQLDPSHFANTETADLPMGSKCLATSYPVKILSQSTKGNFTSKGKLMNHFSQTAYMFKNPIKITKILMFIHVSCIYVTKMTILKKIMSVDSLFVTMSVMRMRPSALCHLMGIFLLHCYKCMGVQIAPSQMPLPHLQFSAIETC